MSVQFGQGAYPDRKHIQSNRYALGNLPAAAHGAAAGKRKRRDVANFLLNPEPELLTLQRELISGEYAAGEYRTFMVHDPKPRHISAAPFRDRVVHHALTNVLEPIFERRFSPYSFACRKGFGVHKAPDRAQHGMREYPYCLKVDVRKYFASIDHEILNGQLARVVKCKPTLAPAAKIIAGSNEQEDVVSYFPGDDLFTPHGRRRGLPLGNQSSQFFANLYFNGLDHSLVGELKAVFYVRYVDDLIFFANSKGDLHCALAAIEDGLRKVRLAMHPGKSKVYSTAEGVTFLGWRLFPGRARLAHGNVARFALRLKRIQQDFGQGQVDWPVIKTRIQAWIGHASYGPTWGLRERLFDRCAFGAGVRP